MIFKKRRNATGEGNSSRLYFLKKAENIEKRFDIRVYPWYTTTVNKEEVPLLTLWHEQIGLIQYLKQG